MVIERYTSLLALYAGNHCPDCKVHGANVGPIWGRHDPGGPYGGPMNFVIWVGTERNPSQKASKAGSWLFLYCFFQHDFHHWNNWVCWCFNAFVTPLLYATSLNVLPRSRLCFDKELLAHRCPVAYCKTSSINRTKSQNLNVSCILLQLSSFTTSNVIVYGECGLMPPSTKCTINSLCFMNRLMHMNGDSLTKKGVFGIGKLGRWRFWHLGQCIA